MQQWLLRRGRLGGHRPAASAGSLVEALPSRCLHTLHESDPDLHALVKQAMQPASGTVREFLDEYQHKDLTSCGKHSKCGAGVGVL